MQALLHLNLGWKIKMWNLVQYGTFSCAGLVTAAPYTSSLALRNWQRWWWWWWWWRAVCRFVRAARADLQIHFERRVMWSAERTLRFHLIADLDSRLCLWSQLKVDQLMLSHLNLPGVETQVHFFLSLFLSIGPHLKRFQNDTRVSGSDLPCVNETKSLYRYWHSRLWRPGWL